MVLYDLFHTSEGTRVIHTNPVRLIHTGHPGRPSKSIDLGFLRNAMSSRRKLKLKRLAHALRMHPRALRARICQAGIRTHHYSPITNDELDILIREYRRRKPNSGLRYLRGWLFSQGIRVQKERIRKSLKRVDGLRQSLLRHNTIDRRDYEVPRPHALWHMDGHHKLIRWGIVVHGIVDGYSRSVCYFLTLSESTATCF
jgi:hypothetical protein